MAKAKLLVFSGVFAHSKGGERFSPPDTPLFAYLGGILFPSLRPEDFRTNTFLSPPSFLEGFVSFVSSVFFSACWAQPKEKRIDKNSPDSKSTAPFNFLLENIY